MSSIILFFLSIGAIFFSDVFATYSISKLSLFLTLTLPFFLFLLTKIEGKKILIPVKETIFYLLFIIFSTISTFLAIDKEIAFQSLLIYIAGYLFFIFSFNYQENLNKYFKWFLIGISIFSSLIFLINKIFTLNLFKEGASLFYGGYYHNELGNLLILGIIVCLYEVLLKNKNKFFILLLFFLPFFIISYSRSAYLSIIVVSVFFVLNKKISIFINKKTIILVFILLMTFLFFITTKEVQNFLPKTINNFMETRLLIPKEKSFTGKRQQHFYYALSTIAEKPFFGVGPGNLYSATVKKQFNWEEGTTTAHNIILDIFAENGMVAGAFFILFLTQIFIKRKKDLYFYLFLSLTLIFLFNFSYRFTSMFLIWIILAGISFPCNKDDIEINNLTILLPIITIFIFGQIILMGKVFYNIGLTNLSLKIYPLNSEVYREIIKINIRKGEKEEGLRNLTKYDSIFKEGFIANSNKGKFYEELKDKKNAIYFYEEAIYDKPLSTSTLLSKIIVLYVDLDGEDVGKLETAKFINQFKKEVIIPKKSDVEKIIKGFCYDYKLKC